MVGPGAKTKLYDILKKHIKCEKMVSKLFHGARIYFKIKCEEKGI